MAISPLRRLLAAAILVAPLADAGAAPPLQLLDTTARPISVEIENSSAIDSVGQSYGAPFPASYSVSGGVGSVVISAATHEAMYAGYIPAPVPGSFTPIVIEIDLATQQAASQVASGGFASGPLTESFSQGVLRSDTTIGVIVSGVPPFTCTSQAQVDFLCTIAPQFCGKTCSFVAGSAYSQATGKLNLVGTETRTGCDGGLCEGPYTFFTPRGDLRLSEVFTPAVPTLAPWATLSLLVALGAAALVASRHVARVA